MLFESIYSSGFRAVGRIINEALERRGINSEEIRAITEHYSIGEYDYSNILDSLIANKSWPFLIKISEDMHGYVGKTKYIPTIENKYNRPMSLVEKKWLNNISCDKRMRLFTDEAPAMSDVGTLFNPDDIVFYDQNSDGDPYDDENYILCFRTILRAIKEKRYIEVVYCTNSGKMNTFKCFPLKLEYSLRNDKFRLINGFVGDTSKTSFLKLSGIQSVEMGDICDNPDQYSYEIGKKSVVLEVSEENSAKERFLLHFSPLKREIERVGDKLWRVKIYYDEDSEEEIVIDILSFGRYVKVVGPDSFKESLKNRLSRQKVFV